MRRLVESWLRAERGYHGNTLAAALRAMNEELATRTTRSRVSEWRRGTYVPSPETLSYMLNRTLAWALETAGVALTPGQHRALEALLWHTYEKDGEPWYDLL